MPVLGVGVGLDAIASYVEPDGRVEGNVLADEDVGEFVVEGDGIFRRAEVALGLAPVADRFGDSAHELPDSAFSLRRTDGDSMEQSLSPVGAQWAERAHAEGGAWTQEDSSGCRGCQAQQAAEGGSRTDLTGSAPVTGDHLPLAGGSGYPLALGWPWSAQAAGVAAADRPDGSGTHRDVLPALAAEASAAPSAQRLRGHERSDLKGPHAALGMRLLAYRDSWTRRRSWAM